MWIWTWNKIRNAYCEYEMNYAAFPAGVGYGNVGLAQPTRRQYTTSRISIHKLSTPPTICSHIVPIGKKISFLIRSMHLSKSQWKAIKQNVLRISMWHKCTHTRESMRTQAHTYAHTQEGKTNHVIGPLYRFGLCKQLGSLWALKLRNWSILSKQCQRVLFSASNLFLAIIHPAGHSQ